MKEQLESENAWNPFLELTQFAMNSLTTTDDDQLLPYEAKLITCGLCKLFFKLDPDLYPRREPVEQKFLKALLEISMRVANALYWQKVKEDSKVYF
jgi:hypothetical protein